MELKALSLSDVEQVRQWRNESLVALRTPFLLTQEQQEQFYREVICNRNARARYWGIVVAGKVKRKDFSRGIWPEPIIEVDAEILIGMCGLENIEWENRLAEISIILNPEYQGKGNGEKAVDLLLDHGFNYLNLENIWGECYTCSTQGIKFWTKVIENKKAAWCHLPCRKYYAGQFWNSLYFNISKSNFKERGK